MPLAKELSEAFVGDAQLGEESRRIDPSVRVARAPSLLRPLRRRLRGGGGGRRRRRSELELGPAAEVDGLVRRERRLEVRRGEVGGEMQEFELERRERRRHGFG